MTTQNFLWNPGTSNDGLLASAVTLLADTSEMASLASNSYVVSSTSGSSGVFNNGNFSQGIWAELFVTLGAIGSALSTGAGLTGYFLRSYDGGSNYEQTGAQPPRPPDFFFSLPATTISAGAIYGASGLILIPPLKFKVGLFNAAGQTLASSGNSIKAAPINMQSL